MGCSLTGNSWKMNKKQWWGDAYYSQIENCAYQAWLKREGTTGTHHPQRRSIAQKSSQNGKSACSGTKVYSPKCTSQWMLMPKMNKKMVVMHSGGCGFIDNFVKLTYDWIPKAKHRLLFSSHKCWLFLSFKWCFCDTSWLDMVFYIRRQHWSSIYNPLYMLYFDQEAPDNVSYF